MNALTTYNSKDGYYKPIVPFNMFNDIFEGLESNFFNTGYPKYEQYIDGDTLVMRFALAGVPKDAISVEANETEIIVKSDKVNKDEKSQFASRSFVKEFRDVTGRWDFYKADVEYINGMLTIRIPPKANTKIKQLKVK